MWKRNIKDMGTRVEFFKTNYGKNIFSEKITTELIYLGNNNFENENGSVVHIFDNLPYLRNIPVNKGWFNQNIYHFNKLK